MQYFSCFLCHKLKRYRLENYKAKIKKKIKDIKQIKKNKKSGLPI